MAESDEVSETGAAPLVPTQLGPGAALPEYASAGAAGADLRASQAVVIAPGARAAVEGLRYLKDLEVYDLQGLHARLN